MLPLILMAGGVTLIVGSALAYLVFATAKAPTIFVGCVGLALLFFSNAAKALGK